MDWCRVDGLAELSNMAQLPLLLYFATPDKGRHYILRNTSHQNVFHPVYTVSYKSFEAGVGCQLPPFLPSSNSLDCRRRAVCKWWSLMDTFTKTQSRTQDSHKTSILGRCTRVRRPGKARGCFTNTAVINWVLPSGHHLTIWNANAPKQLG